MTLWDGQTGVSGKHIESVLRDDPRTTRLALDPDIRLYDWFSRSSDGQRKDLDQLVVHWSGLKTLAGQKCMTLGCVESIAEVGWVFNTPAVALSDVAGDLGQPGMQRRVSFTLLPRHLADLPQVEGLRIVSVSAVVRNKTTGALGSLPNIRLRHSGLGYLLIAGEGVQESLEASDEIEPDFIRDDDKISKRRDELQHRWHNDGVGLAQMEGYALFGLYQAVLPAAFDPAKQSLDMTFFYQQPKSTKPAGAPLPPAILACGKGNAATGLAASEVRLLMRRDANGVLNTLDPAGPCVVAENAQ